MKLVRYIKKHWDDEDFWLAVGDYAAAYGIWGMIALVAGLILAAVLI